MTLTHSTVRPAPPGWPVPVALAVALVAALLRPSLPGSQPYPQVAVPPWVVPAAAVLGAVAVLGRRRIVAVAAAVLLLWAGAGLPLDLFRLFFLVTGIPAGGFELVDGPGLLARAAATTALAVLAAAVRRPGAGAPSWLGAAAVAAAVPYPALKVFWAADGGAHGAWGEVAAFGAAAVLALALTTRWGRVVPRWVLLGGGWSATVALLAQGTVPLFAALAVPFGGPPLPAGASGPLVAAVHGSWVVLGLLLGTATLTYQDRVR